MIDDRRRRKSGIERETAPWVELIHSSLHFSLIPEGVCCIFFFFFFFN